MLRRAVIALATLLLCSCRQMHTPPPLPSSMAGPEGCGPGMSAAAMAGAYGAAQCAPGYPEGPPLPQMQIVPWKPPGIMSPWPHDEYIHDGGDKDVAARVRADWTIDGLEMEDTIVHFDTIDGQTLVQPSNRVCLYAPRFAAVRRVSTVHEGQSKEHVIGYHLPVKANIHEEDQLATNAVQPVAPIGEIGTRRLNVSQLNQNPVIALQRVLNGEVQNNFLPHEDFLAIKTGILDTGEKARLAESVLAAVVWSHDKAVQVILDKQTAVIETSDQRAQTTFRVDLPTNPRLRVCKTASRQMANPGDLVDFTIRFDNVGDAIIGNVTLVDNLTTRLAYVEDTAKSSRDAKFMTEPNAGESLVLRWEFNEPLKPGQGGLVRFQCRVR